MTRASLVVWMLVPLYACSDPAPGPGDDGGRGDGGAPPATDAGLDGETDADADPDAADGASADAAEAGSQDGSSTRDSQVIIEPGCGFRTEKLDLLFVIDNSGSMAEEQELLARELPAMTRALASGDLDGDGTLELGPTDLHVGVVSTDMGLSSLIEGAAYCSRVGDDGLLRSPDACGERPDGYLALGPGDDRDPVAFGEAVGCQIQLGIGGCGLEQPLDAALRAVAPGGADVSFPYGSGGHGDGPNGGFLRDDSVLAVVIVTDEDDCSFPTSSVGLPSTASTGPYADVGLNYRCQAHPELLHPVERYVDGLTQLRPDLPGSVVFAVLAGVPRDLPRNGASIQEMLNDDRMQFEPDGPLDSGLTGPVPACTEERDSGEVSGVPARRLLEVADAFGDHAIVGSICEETFEQPVEQLARLIAGVLDCPETPTLF